MMVVNGMTIIPEVAENMMMTISNQMICVVHAEVFLFIYKLFFYVNLKPKAICIDN